MIVKNVTCRHDIILWKRSAKEHSKQILEAKCWYNINLNNARVVVRLLVLSQNLYIFGKLSLLLNSASCSSK